MNVDSKVVTQFLSLLTIIGDFMVVVLLILYPLYLRSKNEENISFSFLNIITKNARNFSFIVAIIATLGSLYYSDIAGYSPCKLCWYQRILMYPMVLIFAVAIIKRIKDVFLFSIPLSIIGALISIYHYYLQLGGQEIVPCSVVGYSLSCVEKFTLEYGYITIPMMAFTAFLLIIMFSIYGLDEKKRR